MAGLSPRQREVLRLIGDGHTNREVAARLGISVKTAETHRQRLRDALSCNTRAELTAAARLLP